MPSPHIIFLTLLGISLLFYALKTPSNTTCENYSVANRNVGVFALTATLVMTEFNTATLISFSSLGFLTGLKALALPLVFLIGLIFYALTVSKKWKEFNGTTVVDFFIQRYGKPIGTLCAIFLLGAMAGFSATYLKSLTLLFENLLPNASYWTASAFIVLITLFLVIKKGLPAIIKLDSISFIIILIALPIILYKTYTTSTIQTSIHFFNPDLLNNHFILSLIPLTMFSYILAPWYGQRIFAAKNSKVAYTAVILSAFFVFLLYSTGILITYFLAKNNTPLTDPQQAFPLALHQSIKNTFYPLGYLLLFLISSTTLTGVWNAMSNITLDFLPHSKSQKTSILMTLLCALTTYILSNTLIDNILNKMILANIPVVALSFTVFAGFFWPKITKLGIYASIFIGLLSGTSSYFYFGESGNYTIYWSFIGIPMTFITGFLTSWTHKKFQDWNLIRQSTQIS